MSALKCLFNWSVHGSSFSCQLLARTCALIALTLTVNSSPRSRLYLTTAPIWSASVTRGHLVSFLVLCAMLTCAGPARPRHLFSFPEVDVRPPSALTLPSSIASVSSVTMSRFLSVSSLSVLCQQLPPQFSCTSGICRQRTRFTLHLFSPISAPSIRLTSILASRLLPWVIFFDSLVVVSPR